MGGGLESRCVGRVYGADGVDFRVYGADGVDGRVYGADGAVRLNRDNC